MRKISGGIYEIYLSNLINIVKFRYFEKNYFGFQHTLSNRKRSVELTNVVKICSKKKKKRSNRNTFLLN